MNIRPHFKKTLNPSFLLKAKAGLLLLFLLAVCASCGSKKEEGYEYTISDVPLSAKFYEGPENAKKYHFTCKELLYQTSSGSLFYYKINEDGTTESVKPPIPNSEFRKVKYKDAEITTSDDGYFYRLEKLIYPDKASYTNDSGRRIEEREFYLEKYSPDGELLFCNDIGLEIGYDKNHYNRIITDREGTIYYANDNVILLFDPDGSLTHKIPVSIFVQSLLRSDNNVWIIYYYPDDANRYPYVARITRDGELTDEQIGPLLPDADSVAPLHEDKFLYSGDGKLYLADFRNNTVKTLTSWADIGINMNEICGLTNTDDHGLIVALRDPDSLNANEIAVITQADENKLAEMVNLTVGVFRATNLLKVKIADFNRQNEKIRVSLKEYTDKALEKSGYRSDYQQIRTSLHLDIVSGKCPDILCLDYEELEDLAYKNAFEDLTPYLSRESGFDIPANIVDAYTVQGQLVSLPVSVQVRTLFLKDLDPPVQWNTDSFLQYLSEREKEGCERLDAQSVLRYLLTCNLNDYTDFEAMSCDFTSKQFEDLLTACKAVSDSSGKAQAQSIFIIPHSLIRSQPYDTDILELSLCGLWDISAYRQLFHQKELNFAGYPHNGEDSGYILEAVGGSYSIASSSPFKESAWQFITYMATETQQATKRLYNSNAGFPVITRCREKYYQSNCGVWSTGMKNSWSLRFTDPDPEETQQLEAIISSARMLSKQEADILNIILEEAEEYFTLDKPVHEVMKVIQSKVTLYLTE